MHVSKFVTQSLSTAHSMLHIIYIHDRVIINRKLSYTHRFWHVGSRLTVVLVFTAADLGTLESRRGRENLSLSTKHLLANSSSSRVTHWTTWLHSRVFGRGTKVGASRTRATAAFVRLRAFSVVAVFALVPLPPPPPSLPVISPPPPLAIPVLVALILPADLHWLVFVPRTRGVSASAPSLRRFSPLGLHCTHLRTLVPTPPRAL